MNVFAQGQAPMVVSIDWGGCFLEHKEFFNAMASAMQKDGHRVGIITGERESKKGVILGSLGFTPDFMELWPEFEAIGNGAKWKVERMLDQQVVLHFDDDATSLKLWTNLWIVKVMNSGDQKKF